MVQQIIGSTSARMLEGVSMPRSSSRLLRSFFKDSLNGLGREVSGLEIMERDADARQADSLSDADPVHGAAR